MMFNRKITQNCHCEPLGEAIQPIETDVNRHKATGTNSCNHLITQSPVLDLLHAHGDSPKERCSSRLVPFAIRTRYAVLLAGVKRVCNAAAFASPFRPLPARAPSVRKSASHLITSKAAAFTLAEVLITLAVIGIVAVLTIPNLMQNNNQKAWDTAADVFNKRLEVAARVMNTQETLAGYSNTKDFVTELKKHIKITRICDNDELTKCFPEKVFWGAEQEEIDVEKDIKSAKNMGQDDWGTEVIGAQFANGIDALIAYDPNCTQDPYNNQIQASNCVAILYDVSAKKNPNSYGKDLRANGKVLSLGGIECAFEVAGTCYTNPALPTPMTLAECEQAVQEGTLGIKECHYDNDYWAGAVKHCGGVQNMPTPAQLAEIATDLYGDHGFSTSGYEYKDGLTMDKTKSYVSILDAVYGDSVSGRPSGEFAIWSGQESDGYYAYDRGFVSDYTLADGYYRGTNYALAVCLGD